MKIFKKQAYSAAMAPGLRGVTLGDVAREIRNDTALSGMERSSLLSKIDQFSGGAPMSTPVSAFAAGALGAIIARVAAKYFGMSTVGRTLLTAVGFGVGAQLSNRFSTSSRQNTGGWQIYG